MTICEELRQAVLQAAIQGKLTEQREEDGTAEELLEEIRKEKERLIREGKIKKEKKLPEIDEVPFDIPESWKWCRLQNIVTLLGDGIHGTPEYDENGEWYFVNGNNISNGIIIIKDNTKRVNRLEYEKYKKELNEASVLVSINGTIGNIAFYNNEPIILGKSACYFNLIYNEMKAYAFWVIKSDYFLEYAIDKATGTTIKNVSLQAMNNLLFPLPPIAEQHRIVSTVNALMEKIDDLQKIETELVKMKMGFPGNMRDAILQAAMQGKLTEQLESDGTAEELLEEIKKEKERLIKEGKIKREKNLPEISEDEIPFDIPENWKWVRLGTIGKWQSGATPSKSHPEYFGGEIPWLITGDLNDGYIGNHDISNTITTEALENTSVKLNPAGSVLIAMYGATIGKLGILKIPATTNQACCACNPFAGVFNEYLFCMLKALKNNFIDLGAGGAQPNISKEKIVTTLIPLPPLAEQHRIVARLNELLPLCDTLEEAK